MKSPGIVILYGPPTSGKTSLSKELKSRYPMSYSILRKYKLGKGNFDEYTKTNALRFTILEMLQYFTNVTKRHGNKYGVAKNHIRKTRNLLIISTASDVEVDKIKRASSKVDLPCVIIALTDSKEVMLQRLEDRKLTKADMDDRINLWWSTGYSKDMGFSPHLVIDTGLLSLELTVDIADFTVNKYVMDYYSTLGAVKK